jgi:hypothetical protein
MSSNKPQKTAIFLIGSGINMINFYNFDYLTVENNYRLIAIINKKIAGSFPEKQRAYFEKIYMVSEANLNETLCHLSEVEVEDIFEKEIMKCSCAEHIRVFPFNEYNVLLSARLREKFGLQGATVSALEQFRNKLKMKELLNKNGIRIPKFVSLNLKKLGEDKIGYFDELALILGLPFIVKPIDGAGSLGVHKIHSLEDFWTINNGLLNSVAGYEAEEFLDGTLFHYDAIVKNGEVIISFCAEYNYPLIEIKRGKNIGSIPLLDSHPLKYRLTSFAKNALLNLRPQDGIFHTEIFHIGGLNEFVFLETAARAPGALIIPMYEKTFGVNMLDIDFLVQMGMPFNIKPNPQYFSFWAVFPSITGKVKRLIKPKITSQYLLEWFTKVGDPLHSSLTMRDRVARIFVWNQDPSILEKEFIEISQSNYIEVE